MNAAYDTRWPDAVAKSRPSADDLNGILSAGGSVQVTTCLHSTIYKARNAGMFFEDAKGNLCVKSGRGSNCLSFGELLLVGIRTSRVAM